MNVHTARQLTRHAYDHAASSGRLEGYTMDDVAEWTAQTFYDLMVGDLTSDEVHAECDEFCL